MPKGKGYGKARSKFVPKSNISLRRPIQRHFEKKFKKPSYERRYRQKGQLKSLKKRTKQLRKGR